MKGTLLSPFRADVHNVQHPTLIRAVQCSGALHLQLAQEMACCTMVQFSAQN